MILRNTLTSESLDFWSCLIPLIIIFDIFHVFTIFYLKIIYHNFFLSQASGDGTEVTLETASPLLEDGTSERSPLRGELDSAVNNYLDQVRNLGYKDSHTNKSSNTLSFKNDEPIYQVANKSAKNRNSQKTFTSTTRSRSSTRDKLTKKQSLKEESKKNSELVHRFHRRSRSIERLEHQPIILDPEDEIKKPSKDDLLAVQFQLTDEEFSQDEILDDENDANTSESVALDNPLYLNLRECSSGSNQETSEHFYENGSFGGSEGDDEHIYENVDNSEHVYDIVPKRSRPDIPPKPDFLSQLAARQSEPVKRAWNPFVTDDSIDQEEEEVKYSNIDIIKKKNRSKQSISTKTKNLCTNPFRTDFPIGTSEQTITLDGSETSDLGSSGEGSVSGEDWPLPPTPSPGGDDTLAGDSPLPPPPPELALQQLEEQVLREEEEDRLLALQKQKKEIENKYCDKQFKTFKPKETIKSAQVEAVNSRLAHLNEVFNDITNSEEKSKFVNNLECDTIQFVSSTENSDSECNKKQPRIIEIEGDESDDFDTPAIRHSVIIELKDSCLLALKPSDIKRKESIRRSESLKKAGIIRKSGSYRSEDNRLMNGSLFSRVDKDKSKNAEVELSSKDDFSFVTQFDEPDITEQIIEISEDGTWSTKGNKMDKNSANGNGPDIDPFTGQPIPVPPPRAAKIILEDDIKEPPNIKNLPDLVWRNEEKLKEPIIAAPPEKFQTLDGSDGVFSASIVATHSGPSSIASSATENNGEHPETPTLKVSKLVSEGNHQGMSSEVYSFVKENNNKKTSVTGIKKPPLPIDSADCDDRPSTPTSNIGAAIMESYERDIQKKKDSMNLPEVSLLEFGDSVKDLEQQRRSVIKQMTVKAKKKDTWIKTCKMHDSGSAEEMPTAPSRAKKKNSFDFGSGINNEDTNSSEDRFSIRNRANMFANEGVSKHEEINRRNSFSSGYKQPQIVDEGVRPARKKSLSKQNSFNGNSNSRESLFSNNESDESQLNEKSSSPKISIQDRIKNLNISKSNHSKAQTQNTPTKDSSSARKSFNTKPTDLDSVINNQLSLDSSAAQLTSRNINHFSTENKKDDINSMVREKNEINRVQSSFSSYESNVSYSEKPTAYLQQNEVDVLNASSHINDEGK